MSNGRLALLLLLALVILIALVLRDIELHGSYAGFGAACWFLPGTFILSLLFAIACGLRRTPHPYEDTDDDQPSA